MISLARPDRDAIDAVLGNVGSPSRPMPSFSYCEVGATNRPAELEALRARYTIDRRLFSLGRGRALFDAARQALFAWRHFEIPWLELEGTEFPVQADRMVATLTRIFGFWFLSPCRVVYRADPPGSPAEVAFAYGTVGGHVASGEERFTLRLDPTSDEVVFEILAFSRPATVLTRIGQPFMRRIQRRFAGDAAAALARACAGHGASVREVSIG